MKQAIKYGSVILGIAAFIVLMWAGLYWAMGESLH
jgi:hypothetical protein